MPLYTFVLDFKGGTYISQVEASSESEACVRWAKQLDWAGIDGFERRCREELIGGENGEKLLPVEGLRNVWCQTALLGDDLALVHLVLTEKGTDNRPPPADN
jgi:hypothetical protein